MPATTNVFATCPRCDREVAQGAWTLATVQAVLDGAQPAFVCPTHGIFELNSTERQSLQAFVDTEQRRATMALAR